MDNIIFVFSDAMYLNMYLNKNLNTTSFQKNIQTKIEKLSSYIIPDSKLSIEQLLKEHNMSYIELNRNMDGMLNSESGKTINDNIIKEKYSFTIDGTCNNYTSILEDNVDIDKRHENIATARKRIHTLDNVGRFVATAKNNIHSFDDIGIQMMKKPKSNINQEDLVISENKASTAKYRINLKTGKPITRNVWKEDLGKSDNTGSEKGTLIETIENLGKSKKPRNRRDNILDLESPDNIGKIISSTKTSARSSAKTSPRSSANKDTDEGRLIKMIESFGKLKNEGKRRVTIEDIQSPGTTGKTTSRKPTGKAASRNSTLAQFREFYKNPKKYGSLC